MIKEKMTLVKDSLSFSEAIGHIQSGEDGIFIRRNTPVWADDFIGLSNCGWIPPNMKWLSHIKFRDKCGIYADSCNLNNISERDVLAKDWEVYKYERKEL